MNEAHGDSGIGWHADQLWNDHHGLVRLFAGGAIDGPAFAAIAALGGLAFRGFGEGGVDQRFDPPAFLREHRFRLREGELQGLLQTRRTDFCFDAGEHKVAIAVATDAAFRERWIWKHVQAQAAESALRNRALNDVGGLGWRRTACEIGSVFDATEGDAAGGMDRLRHQGFPLWFALCEILFEFGFPGSQQCGQGFLRCLDGRFRLGHVGRQCGERLLLLRIRHLDRGVGIAAGAVRGAADHAGLVDIVEEGKQAVELLLCDRVVLVVVTAGAAQR